ncbi:MAG: DNA polymerase ligase N-terminal domain-containing protein [Thermoguttaceae bacterium]|jgi:DNA ligase D-like protein (predicted 3'-phosphoesterase)
MSADQLRFVIQRHQARTLHYDFRLEREGVFKSWALPKEIPTKHGIQRLAIETADHDLAFGDFEGAIPDGEYGAGTIEIWDRGTYTEDRWEDDLISVTLAGAVVNGRYTLRRFARGGDKAWLLSKAAQ